MTTDLSTPEHWDSRQGHIRPRAPSRLNVGVRDITDLLSKHIKLNDAVLEVGCAPGKYLLWCALKGRAKVSGIEYAPVSHRATGDLFAASNVAIDLRCEDVFSTSFQSGSFDLVYSLGLIEHFSGDRLTEIVRKHVELLKPGGTALMVIPDFSGWYGSVVKHNDAEVYATHNIDMMDVATLPALAPSGTIAKAYRYGKLTPWILTYSAPKTILHKAAMYGANFVGLLQPFTIPAICPWLVLEITRPT